MFFEPRNRILISGDALWEKGMGFVWPQEGANPFVDAALETLARIERLDPAVVIPGHGEPFAGVQDAIGRVRSRLGAFARQPAKNARHVVKVMFVFALLERQGMPRCDVAGYLDRVACYRQLSERFIGLEAEALAEWILADLERAGAIRMAGADVLPTMAA